MADTDLRLTRQAHANDPDCTVLVRIERPSDSGDAILPVVFVMHGFKSSMHWGFFPELSRRIAAGMMASV